MDAHYRKLNDHSHSSSTYHKKDGTAVRAILKSEVDLLVEAYESGYIDAKEYDEQLDDFMRRENGE